MSNKVFKFKELEVNTPFTPSVGEIGSGDVYLKKLNGCCPRLLAEETHVFWPNDKVMVVEVPKKILERELSKEE